MNKNMMIGERIKYLRESYDLSQVDFAKKIGTTRASVNLWENGVNIPTISFIVEIAKLFKVTTDSIIMDDANIDIIAVDNLSQKEIRFVKDVIDLFDNNSDVIK